MTPEQQEYFEYYYLVPSSQNTNYPRFKGIKRNYTAKDVAKLRGTVRVEHTLADQGSLKFWNMLHENDYVHALGAVTGNQAIQMVKAGLKAIYLSGWQVAADANGNMYPDQSLYTANSGPDLCKRINKALQRSDQIECNENLEYRDWFAPIIADAEAGFGGSLNVFEITKAYIEAGASAVHLEDQLASEKKCGHMGGKVLIPTSQHIKNLNAARLAADISGVPTVIIARTDAESAKLITSDIDPVDHVFIDESRDRTPEGFHHLKGGAGMGLANCIRRAYAYAPYCDMIWFETSKPNLDEARIFADSIHTLFPGKLLAYNCSPSFNWGKNLTREEIKDYQKELGKMGYKFQFVTLAGFHSLNHGMFTLAKDYHERDMLAYSCFQNEEFNSEKDGYTASKHQREVGTGYFDSVSLAISGGNSSTTAMKDSTEKDQFNH